jgi:ADP-ribose pyrophosphatase YjhB (NUDIX family)
MDERHAQNQQIQHATHAGGIVIGDGGTIALVRNMKTTKWFFPKGHLDEVENTNKNGGGNSIETHEDCARREIQEEAGLTNLELIADLGTYERYGIGKDGNYTNEAKIIHMFLFAAEPRAEVSPSMEIAEARWASYREVAALLEDAKDTVWFASVFDRVREAIQRD